MNSAANTTNGAMNSSPTTRSGNAVRLRSIMRRRNGRAAAGPPAAENQTALRAANDPFLGFQTGEVDRLLRGEFRLPHIDRQPARKIRFLFDARSRAGAALHEVRQLLGRECLRLCRLSRLHNDGVVRSLPSENHGGDARAQDDCQDTARRNEKPPHFSR